MGLKMHTRSVSSEGGGVAGVDHGVYEKTGKSEALLLSYKVDASAGASLVSRTVRNSIKQEKNLPPERSRKVTTDSNVLAVGLVLVREEP